MPQFHRRALCGGAFRIGSYRVEVGRRRVLRAGDERAIPPKAMEVLLALIAAGNQVVTREDLLQEVWRGATVGDQVLSTAVWQLRAALEGACSGGTVVETVPRLGYRLTVRPIPQPYDGPPAPPPGAVACHLRARTLVRGPGYAEVECGVQQLQEGSHRWPDFAPIHADLAHGLYTLARWGRSPGLPLLTDARAAARRALELAPELHEARAIAVLIDAALAWSPATAAARLADLAPSTSDHPEVLDSLARCLGAVGRFDEAVQVELRALAADPLSPPYGTTLGFLLRLAGRSRAAIARLERTMELAPGWPVAALELARVHLSAGRIARATEIMAGAEPEWAELLLELAHGRSAAAHARLERQLAAREPYVAPYWLAERCVWAARYEDALCCLERAWEERQVQIMFVGVDPVFGALRGHVRFQRLLGRMAAAEGDPATISPQPERRHGT
ncbi:MAG TPA: winged helix-turn-helix domain-containing protein [Candidatus Sulfomarinibacteraceae bacterium]|nr:winged helix-turn-helix domain-containing protein [Candidatus Sulfomarinibacteraceae bacterium]